MKWNDIKVQNAPAGADILATDGINVHFCYALHNNKIYIYAADDNPFNATHWMEKPKPPRK